MAGAMSANATLLVDRGLPTANLNNDAGASRANVDWLAGDFSPASSTYTVIGDSFQNTSSQTWNINQITLWTDGGTDSAILWGGIQGSAMGIVQGSGVISGPITYANGSSYQSSSGNFFALHQINFAVNVTLAAGQTFDFFLDGTDPTSGYGLPFVEASNAALSGSPQQGADNLMLQALVSGGTLGSITTWTSFNNGWDKASDVNVQVFGTAVPEPTTMVAGALLLLPFGAHALRILRKSRTA